MKTTKRAMLSSVIALFLCFTMLLGTTYAWFTDEVTSANNVIQSGTLDVAMSWADGTMDPAGANTVWNDASAGPIYTSKLWEPGYMDAKHIKISNEGTLGLKYQLAILPNGEVSKLAEVIDVYLFDGTKAITREEVKAATPVGTLADLIANGISQGELLVDAVETVTIALVMREEAGNEYQNLSIGSDFSIRLLATQLAAEGDSFGPDYDEDAWVNGMLVYNAGDLQAAISAGENVVLMNDVTLNEPIVIPAAASTFSMRSTPVAQVIDLNGKKISTAYNEETKKHQYAIDNYGNLVIEGGVIEARGIYNREGANLTVNGTKIVNLDTNGGSSIWSYGGSVVLNNAELIGYTGCVYSNGYLEINGGTYTCYSAVLDDGTQLTPTYNIRSNGDLVINGGDFTSRHGLIAVGGPSAVINGGTYTMTSIGVITSHVFYVSEDSAVVTVNGGTFNCDLRTAQANGSSMICVDAADVTVSVKGGIFNLTPAAYVADGFKAAKYGDLFYVLNAENAADNCVYVATVAELKAIADAVNSGADFFEGKKVVLLADVDLAGINWTPIGSAYLDHGFMGDFDGNGYKIKNLSIVNTAVAADDYAYAGFFGVTEGAEGDQNSIKNLVIENVTISTTGQIAAAAVAYPYYTALENITVCGDIAIVGGNYTAGVLAYTRRCVDAKNIIICGNDGSYVKGAITVGGVISDIQTNGGLKVNYSNFTASNITVEGDKAVGGISGIIGGQTLSGATVENVTLKCSDAHVGIVSGSYDGKPVINDATYADVTGADFFVGAPYSADSNGYVYINGVEYVGNGAALKEALAAGKDVIFANDITMKATESNAYGATGIVVNGQTVDGNGFTLKVTNANGKWDSAIFVKSGTVKNITVASAFRGIFTSDAANGDIYLDTVSFDGVVYTFNSDGTNAVLEGGVYLTNCAMNGWTSHSNTHKEVVYTNCTFAEGSGYAYCRPYGSTQFIDCTFAAGYTIDKSQTTEIVFENCTFEK